MKSLWASLPGPPTTLPYMSCDTEKLTSSPFPDTFCLSHLLAAVTLFPLPPNPLLSFSANPVSKPPDSPGRACFPVLPLATPTEAGLKEFHLGWSEPLKREQDCLVPLGVPAVLGPALCAW